MPYEANEGIFQDIFGVAAIDVANTLLSRAKLAVGFEAQEFDRHQPSVSSSGIISYSLLCVPSLPVDTARLLIAEMEGWIGNHGQLVPRVPVRSESTWANAQCLLALCQRVDLIQDPGHVGKLVKRMEEQRRPSGGWPLRPGLPGNDHAVFSVYPILSLIAAYRANLAESSVPEILGAEAVRFQAMASCASCPALDMLVYLALLKLLSAHGLCAHGSDLVRDAVASLAERIWRDGRLRLGDVTITDENQPIWYARIFRPGLYMFARQLWPVGHPIPTLLAEELRQRFDANHRSWGHRQQRPLSWATALGLRTGLALAVDLSRSSLTLTDWKARIQQFQPSLQARYDYDVVIAFAGRQRAAAEVINLVLKAAGFVTFYDYDHEHDLLGEDLTVVLHRVYFSRSRYAVALLSADFVESKWAGNWEWKAILGAMQQRDVSYLLPYFYDDVSVPGLNPAIGYVKREHATPEEFAGVVVRKLRKASR